MKKTLFSLYIIFLVFIKPSISQVTVLERGYQWNKSSYDYERNQLNSDEKTFNFYLYSDNSLNSDLLQPYLQNAEALINENQEYRNYESFSLVIYKGLANLIMIREGGNSSKLLLFYKDIALFSTNENKGVFIKLNKNSSSTIDYAVTFDANKNTLESTMEFLKYRYLDKQNFPITSNNLLSEFLNGLNPQFLAVTNKEVDNNINIKNEPGLRVNLPFICVFPVNEFKL